MHAPNRVPATPGPEPGRRPVARRATVGWSLLCAAALSLILYAAYSTVDVPRSDARAAAAAGPAAQGGARLEIAAATGMHVQVHQVAGELAHVAPASVAQQSALQIEQDTETPTALPAQEGPAVTPSEPADTPTVYVSSVDGRFFYNPTNSDQFVLTTQTPPAFDQQFPSINFDPSSLAGCSAATPIGQGTRPFTDLIPGTPCVEMTAGATLLSPTPTVLLAGVGGLAGFQSVFIGTLYVSQPGDVAFQVYADDGFILGIGPKINGNGEQPGWRTGTFQPFPSPGASPPPSPHAWPTTVFQNYYVAGQRNGSYGSASFTVYFPADGFYPIEMDYAENGNGGLSLTLGTSYQDPIPPGPSATPTVTASPTSTPTRTPISQPPTYTVSYYINQTSTGAARSLGCSVRAQDVHGIVVLDFGAPYDFAAQATPPPTGHIYGAKLPISSKPILLWPPGAGGSGGDSLPTNDIYDVALWFADGYALGCDPQPRPNPNMQLTMAIGATNSTLSNSSGTEYPNPYLTYDNGWNWAAMVDAVNTQLDHLGYYPKLNAVGAYDAEPGWSWRFGFDSTYNWAGGYTTNVDGNLRHESLYDFGSCDGCVRDQPRPSWTSDQIALLKQVSTIASGLPRTKALPEIYHPPLAEEWYNVRRYKSEWGIWMDIAGVMTECGSSGCDPGNQASWADAQFNCYDGGCADFPPNQGWQALHDTHNAPCTPDGTVHPIRGLPLRCTPNGMPNLVPPPHVDDLTDISNQPTATPTP
jgi:hypothetical protein